MTGKRTCIHGRTERQVCRKCDGMDRAALHSVSDAIQDLAAAGRWRRDGWHDTACWQAWIADPERGCICA